jgi:glycosyltransferase involved in cell wall biosynthesis
MGVGRWELIDVPTVSVITPAWNAERFIGDAIASVLAQTFTNWEMVIVDDGSTDGTAALVETYAARNPRIRLLRQQNAGPSAARNHAMREARGSFFAFLDSDDRWTPEFLRAQVEVFGRYPDTALVTANGVFDGGPFDGRPMKPVTTLCPTLPLTEIITDETAVFIMTVFRREVFETIGGFDETQWTSEDYDFWLRAAIAGFVFRRNPQPLGIYRVRGNSLSRNRIRMIDGLLESFAKARARCGDCPDARAAIDRQVARFESERLLEDAKDALERRHFSRAADRLRALHARNGGRMIALTAWLAEHIPAAAALAYRARAWRPRGRRAGSAHPRTGAREREAA